MLIHLKKISCIYNIGSQKVKALNNVTLDIEKGMFIALMGVSGSGKSTLMHILGCLHKPTDGKYVFENMDVSTLTDDELAFIRNQKIGFVFQTFNLIPRLSAIKNVELPLIYRGMPKDKRIEMSKEALEKVNLQDRATHKPSELSGGQQQRVVIARALVTNPSVLLADEPTGNLDSNTGEEIMKIFAGLNIKGMTVILVTHDKEKAEYAKRIINLKDGEIISDVSNN